MNKENNIELEMMKMSKMIEDVYKSYEEDKEIAKENYEILKNKLVELHATGLPMSEEGSLEREVNNALKMYVDISKRLDKTFEVLSKMFNTQVINHTKLMIADKIIDGSNKLNAPMDFKLLK